ncbi:MAG: ArsR/SmtB family transcription factor [Sporichthyaceae bacterium]
MSTEHRAAKDALYDGFAVVAKAFANGRRAELIDVLSQGERSVEELSAEIGQSVANTSQHLRTLAQAGIVRSRRDGSRVIYSVASPRVPELWRGLRDLAVERVAEVDRLVAAYLGDRSGLESMSRQELAARLQAGEVVVLDVRPEAEFRAGHIAGARLLPPDELQRRLAELPRDVEFVAYCRGPYCVYADEAVRMLHLRGQQARRLEDGFPEWAQAGLPVDSV